MTELITEEKLIPDGASVVLPPYGFVHLQAHCASDLDVVNCARVSFAKKSDWEKRVLKPPPRPGGPMCPWCRSGRFHVHEGDTIRALKEEDEGVLRFLMKNQHGTPFEHNFFKFHVRAPIFVFREWHRHRIGISINEESARYSPLQGHFYVPEEEAWRHQVGKPGNYTFEQMSPDQISLARPDLEAAYDVAFRAYSLLMERGVAKEVARLCLPVGIYSQMIWCCNARSLMNFLRLRNAPTAQREIRLYAEAMEAIFAQVMPITHDAFIQNERTAP